MERNGILFTGKTTRNYLERVIEGASANNVQYLASELKEVLESNKAYQSKCDYIGYSIASLDEKASLVDEQIKELKSYKSKLKEAKSLVLEVGAKVFNDYGIQKLEGAGISSITVSKEMKSSKTSLVVLNEQKLIDAGFYTLKLDEKAILESYNNDEYKELILQNCTIETKEIITKPKLRVNKRRASNNDGSIDVPDIA